MDQPTEMLSAETKRCLASMRCRRAVKARVIIVFGKTGAGKSSLVEAVTGRTGLSGDSVNSVTTACEIAVTCINQEDYYLIDTPGFDDDNTAWDTFSKIMEMIEEIRGIATIVGVWYVVDNSRPRDEAFERTLRSWLAAFCGEEFFPYLTIITTFWDCRTRQDTEKLEKRLQQRKQLWSPFLDHGAKTYEHGKVYENGVARGQFLSWEHQQSELATQARSVVARVCHELPSVQPRLFRELGENSSYENTTAANVLRQARSPPSAGRDVPGENSERQSARNTSSADWSQKPSQSQAQPNNQQPSENQHQHTHMPQQSRGQSQQNNGNLNSSDWVGPLFRIGLHFLEQGIQAGYSPGASSAPGGFTHRSSDGFNSKVSLVDFLNERGQDSSLGAREVLAQKFNIKGSPGSPKWNGDILRKLWSMEN
ncbi:uncharacterized protein Z519_00547 [Cladophialophora bantiana CBS 173.52]|uniref:G domain-containing protein n=1 Tax=Cladophialophora bantiana (strain ATCC 10958 / CBS 173.52 / CDC B-1940 / NIH 8579) TaxID=1442370 RepID=A0A0D2IQ19_CLAB1|nr:uncharacterized protein Z519_00547 [Cladophialophora bantiana CBS 173.52]KIW98884.1 hypothetical protein Z519_00547 [Cladophialophora bantiana CBS 173.52]